MDMKTLKITLTKRDRNYFRAIYEAEISSPSPSFWPWLETHLAAGHTAAVRQYLSRMIEQTKGT